MLSVKKSRVIEKLKKRGEQQKKTWRVRRFKKNRQRRKGMILLWCFSLSHTKRDLLTPRGSENLLVCACICKYLETLMVTKPGQPPQEWTTFPGISKDSYRFSVQFSGWIVSAIQACPKRNPLWKKYPISETSTPRHSVNENMFLSNSASGFPSCHRFPKTKRHNSHHRYRVQLHAIAGRLTSTFAVSANFSSWLTPKERSLALGC